LAIGIFIGNGCEGDEPINYSGQITELEKDTLRLGTIRDSLTHHLDSLETIPPKIDRQIIFREREIDENIASGISTPIGEYRRSLQDNNWLPDSTESLSLREITLGAKGLAKLPKIELKAKLYETETVPTLKADVKNYSFLYKSSQELNKIKDINLKQKDEQIDDMNVWYKNRYLWFGLGAIATGLTVYLVK
jgi:hypothetical protein